MLCEQAEKLIPLFAGDDLPAREAEALNRHLESCADCRHLASEFEESRDWLYSFATPQLDEAMLGGLRDSVLKEIGQEETRPGSLERILPRGLDHRFGHRKRQWRRGGFSPPTPVVEEPGRGKPASTLRLISSRNNDQGLPRWNPRSAFAASLALLLLIAAFGLLLLRQQPPQTPNHDQAVMKKGAGNEIGSQPGATRDEPDSKIVNRKPERRGFTRKPRRPELNHSPQPEAQTIEWPDPAKTDLAANREMTRIEFQTADPNIRIIWLTPKDSSSTRPNTNIR